MADRRNARLLRGIWPVLTAVAFFSAFLNLLTLTVPLYMLQVYDRVINSGSMSTLTMLTVIAVGCLLIYTGFEVVRGRLVARASARLEYDAGPLALEASLAAASRRGSPKSAQPLRDLQEVRAFIASPGFLAFIDAPWVPAYTALIFLAHPLLGLVALIGAMALAALGVASELMSRSMQRDAREAALQASRRAEGYIRHAEVIQAMGLQGAIKARWMADVDAAFAPMSFSADRSVLMAGLAKFIRAALQIALLGVGVVLVLRQQITAGQMVAASVLSARAFAPLEQSIGAWRTLVSARAAYSRLKEDVKALPGPGARMQLPDPEGRITMQDVVVTTPGRSRTLLAGISLDIMPGEIIGITGPSGAGKSTLARVIAGLEMPARGTVRIDGADLADWPPEQLGSAIGFLPQQTALFSGTIADNIAALAPEPDPDLITEAAIATGTHEMILALPGGYNAEVGWDGEMLSAGQRQRIGLARAFHGGRRVIVLDEPNANLDVAGDAALASALSWARQQRRTVVLVTHRREILGKVDRIVMLEEGRIVRIGRPGPTLVKGSGKAAPAAVVGKAASSVSAQPLRARSPAPETQNPVDPEFTAMVRALRQIS